MLIEWTVKKVKTIEPSIKYKILEQINNIDIGNLSLSPFIF